MAAAKKKPAASPKLSDGKGTLAMAILGLLFFIPGFSFISIPALIDSVDQRRRAREAGVEPASNIKVSFVLSIIGIALLVLVGIALSLFMLFVMDTLVERISDSSSVIQHNSTPQIPNSESMNLKGTY